jgi:hypothetical protein
MTDDTRDYIDRSRTVGALSSDDAPEQIDENLVTRFALYGHDKRVQILEEMERTASRGDMEVENLREEMTRANMRHRMLDLHHQLRKRGR